MIFLTEHGDGIEIEPATERGPDQRLMAEFAQGTDEQIRGFLARMLREAQIPSNRAQNILRVGKTQYFADLARPWPGINDAPKRNRSRRERRDAAHGEPA